MPDLRKTKIICTLGPAVDSEENLRALIRVGMNAARFNFSHDSHWEHLKRMNWLKGLRESMGRPVAAILDTRGPEIRIGTFSAGRVELQEGAVFILTTREVEGDAGQVSVTYPELHREVSPGQEILLDDGLVSVRVDRVEGQDIYCTVEHGGPLSAHKSINIPGVHICLPALTEKDVDQMTFISDPVQKESYQAAVPRQYKMLLEAAAVIVPLMKKKTDILHPANLSDLNVYASIWCSIENLWLAATAEGYGCNLRIPCGDEEAIARKALGFPDGYLIPCFIGIGRPAPDAIRTKQIDLNFDELIHWQRF